MDINSNFIDKEGNSVADSVQDRIIDVSLDSLKAIGLTVALSAGKKKVDATEAAMRKGAVDFLIADSVIGGELS